MSDRPLVYLFDAHYQIFRAYHSMPDLRAPDGAPVGAVRGYASVLIKFLREYEPTHVAAAFDFDMRSFRNDLYPEYKLGRQAAPEDLEPQFDPCRRVTRALGIPVFELEKYEADDVIATLTLRLLERGADVAIITADKDLGALISDRVHLLDLRSGDRTGAPELQARLGVPPELVTDYLSLVGDAVDNIPGVRGIGAKTAAALLNHFGSADLIPEDAAEWSGLALRGAARAAACLRDGRDHLRLSRELVRLRDDLPIRVRLGDLAYTGADRTTFSEVCEPLGAGSLVSRVSRWRD